jgi:hypothetical protein
MRIRDGRHPYGTNKTMSRLLANSPYSLRCYRLFYSVLFVAAGQKKRPITPWFSIAPNVLFVTPASRGKLLTGANIPTSKKDVGLT